jgi:hypothetical protein
VIVVAEALGEIAYLRHSLPGVDAFILKSANEGMLTDQVSKMMALADSAAYERLSVPSILFAGATPLKLAADRVLFLADEPGDSCYRVEDGLLKVTMRDRRSCVWKSMAGLRREVFCRDCRADY